MKRSLPRERTVDLWWADLRCEIDTSADRCLSPDEMARGARFAIDRLRIRFFRRRILLRQLLASYLDRNPAAIEFRTGRFGKPNLTGHLDWSFNASHSEDWFVCAVSSHERLGVDVEALHEFADAPAIAARFFTICEQGSLRGLGAADRLVGFFECWTRKEALVKATGLGLTLPLASFDVAVGPRVGNCLVASRLPSLERRDWQIVDATRAGTPVCAVAADGPIHRVCHHEWLPHVQGSSSAHLFP